MDFYRIPYEEDGSQGAAAFNEGIKTEEIDGTQDVYKVDWVTGQPDDEFFIGHKVCPDWEYGRVV